MGCGRLAAEAMAGVLTAHTGGAAIYDPIDIQNAREQGRWDLDDLPAGDPGCVKVQAYLAETPDLPQRLAGLQLAIDDLRSWSGETVAVQQDWVDEADWATVWQAYFTPLPIGQRLEVIPVWHQEVYPGAPDRLPVFLDPGMAFGTGQHATTALCMAWLEELVRPRRPVLDVGTGSGILAISAARLGAGPVLGIDIDAVAVGVARRDVALNRLQRRVQLLHGELASSPVQQWLHDHPPHVVVANLVAGLIVTLAPQLAAATPAGGYVLTSGIITERRAEVAAGLEGAGLSLIGTREVEGWLAMLARKS